MIFRASVSLLGAYRPVGMHTFCSAGIMVGQSEAHAHFQIQPRYDDRPYSFAPAGDLPIIKMSDRVAMAERLQPHGSEAPQGRDALSSIRFRDLAVPGPSPRAGMDPNLVVDETRYFVALCHPQSRGPGAVMIMAKREVSCFLELNAPERTDLLILVRNIARAAETIYAPDGLSIWWDTGEEANHSYSEFVAEVVPRFAGLSYVPEYRQDREHIEAGAYDELVEAVSSYRTKMGTKVPCARMVKDVAAAHS
jgi:diadenosine tetraphosphate (Ap4A) HIT family hydrolase